MSLTHRRSTLAECVRDAIASLRNAGDSTERDQVFRFLLDAEASVQDAYTAWLHEFPSAPAAAPKEEAP